VAGFFRPGVAVAGRAGVGDRFAARGDDDGGCPQNAAIPEPYAGRCAILIKHLGDRAFRPQVHAEFPRPADERPDDRLRAVRHGEHPAVVLFLQPDAELLEEGDDVPV